jgi:hypothetical protein
LEHAKNSRFLAFMAALTVRRKAVVEMLAASCSGRQHRFRCALVRERLDFAPDAERMQERFASS